MEDEKFHLVYLASPSHGIFTGIDKDGLIEAPRKKLYKGQEHCAIFMMMNPKRVTFECPTNEQKEHLLRSPNENLVEVFETLLKTSKLD